MPYSGKDDANLPENVKKMADDQRSQWVAVFNSTLSDCKDKDPKVCEGNAFATANGVVKQADNPTPPETPPAETPPADKGADGTVKKLADLLKKIVDEIKAIIGQPEQPPAETPPAEPVQQTYLKDAKGRAIAFPDVYQQVQQEITKYDPTGMLHDVYYDEAGVFAMCASMGKLYKIPVNLKGDVAVLGTWEEINVSQSRRGMYKVYRTKEGRYRWVTVSASAVLNRVGEIDSRELFDDFIQRAEQTGVYPIRVFYHAGEKFRVGQCDFLARDENLLITSGLYDENNELAMREVVARTKEPDFWGDSIGFLPMSVARLIAVGYAKIPVYTRGILEEISTLPEQEAAGWFTNRSTVKEITRMLSQHQMEAFVKLFDGNEEAARTWLKEHSSERNRQIVDQGMITRAQQELGELLAGTGAAVTPPATSTATTPPTTPAPATFELDEIAMTTLAERVAAKINFADTLAAAITQATTPLSDQLTRMNTRLDALEKGQTAVTQSIKPLLATEDEKRRMWLADAPEKTPATTLTFRPRTDRAKDPSKPSDPQEVLNKLPSY